MADGFPGASVKLTDDFYGPNVVSELIRVAPHPYPADLRVVTKVGAR